MGVHVPHGLHVRYGLADALCLCSTKVDHNARLSYSMWPLELSPSLDQLLMSRHLAEKIEQFDCGLATKHVNTNMNDT